MTEGRGRWEQNKMQRQLSLRTGWEGTQRRVLAMACGGSHVGLPMSSRTGRGNDGLIAQFGERGVWQGKATVYRARGNRKKLLSWNLTLESALYSKILGL